MWHPRRQGKFLLNWQNSVDKWEKVHLVPLLMKVSLKCNYPLKFTLLQILQKENIAKSVHFRQYCIQKLEEMWSKVLTTCLKIMWGTVPKTGKTRNWRKMKLTDPSVLNLGTCKNIGETELVPSKPVYEPVSMKNYRIRWALLPSKPISDWESSRAGGEGIPLLALHHKQGRDF